MFILVLGLEGKFKNEVEYGVFLSQIEPTSIEQALEDCDWIIAMQEELNQFERSQVWELVPRPSHQSIVGTHYGSLKTNWMRPD